jgi:hypothetical protein
VEALEAQDKEHTSVVARLSADKAFLAKDLEEARGQLKELGLSTQVKLGDLSKLLDASSVKVSGLEEELRAAKSKLDMSAEELAGLKKSREDLLELMESSQRVNRQLEKTKAEAEAHLAIQAKHLQPLCGGVLQTLSALGLPVDPVPAASLSGIISWLTDTVGKLEALPEVLAKKVTTDGEKIADIIGNTILPRVEHLYPNFPFELLFEKFEEDDEGRAAEAAARAAAAPAIASLKRRMKRKPLAPGA